MKATAVVTEDPTPLSPRSRFQAAMILAMAADALQIFVFPLFAEGALSPADDVLDLAVAAVLVNLLGWHWEFLPAFADELVPGVDLVPFWTIAVINVYRKWKQITITTEEIREQHQRLLRSLGYRDVGGIDVDALLRQLPGQLRQCAGLVFQFTLLQRALGVGEARPAQSLLGLVHVIHHHLHGALPPGSAV